MNLGIRCLFLFLGAVALNLSAAEVSAGPALESVYTDLVQAKCKKVKEDVEYEEEKCPGVAGYTLNSIYSDQRQSVTVVSPTGAEAPLNFWEVVSPAFGHLGDKAEWRVVREGGKVVPKALIVRYTTVDSSGAKPKSTSHLAVAKITPAATCVTDVIGNVPNANELARTAADVAEGKPCLKAKP